MVSELVESNCKGVSEGGRVRFVSLHKHEHKKGVCVSMYSVHLSSVQCTLQCSEHMVSCRAQPQSVQSSV